MNQRTHILEMPQAADFVQFDPSFGTRFVLTIDTEEEFDWSQPLDRTNHGLAHVPRLAKFQQFCEENIEGQVYAAQMALLRQFYNNIGKVSN